MSEEKIEVGEYYRTDNGKIYKWSKGRTYIGKNKIVKHSKNIIDLIEVGDYVNGKEVKHIAMFEGFPDYPKLIFVDEHRLLPDETCENKDIKSIVTKEQFESIKYKVEK